MKRLPGILGLIGCATQLVAGTLPPEQLLPPDTLAVFAVPDYDQATAAQAIDPGWQLWRDPAMKPFREKLEAKLKTELLQPLEKELGIRFADYAGLAKGQVTLALIQNGWQGTADPVPAWLLLVDAKDKKDELGQRLTELRKKLTEGGHKTKVERIRDVECTTLSLSKEDLPAALRKLGAKAGEGSEDADEDEDPAAAPSESKPAAKPVEITFGQSDSLLVVGSHPKVIERALLRQSGGSATPLAEEPTFQKEFQSRLRTGTVYGWAHLKPLVDLLTAKAKEADAKSEDQNAPFPMPRPSTMVAASGLGGLRQASFVARSAADGTTVEMQLGVPAEGRTGLFEVFGIEPKEAGPIPAVPANAVTFWRWRIDLPKSWAALEKMVNEISPQASGMLNMMLQGGGQDPNFNPKADLLGNLGDDVMGYELRPKGSSFAELGNAPSLFLMASPDAGRLAAAIKSMAAMLPPLSNVKEREFQGRKIYAIDLSAIPGAAAPGGAAAERQFSFAASGGYLAMSTDAAILETYLRSAEDSGKSLREVPGLAEAVRKVGGYEGGLFGYQNDQEVLRSVIETLRNDTAGLEQILNMTPLGSQFSQEDGKRLKDWVDFSLLPEFDRIAKYFHFTVYAARRDGEGYNYRVYTPMPPQLRP